MTESEMRDMFRRRAAEKDQQPPIEQVRSFLGGYLSDATSVDEVRADLRRLASTNVRGIQRHLRSVEALLADPPSGGVLARLVGWDGNWVLDDPSDTGALAFLLEMSALLRDVLAEFDQTRSQTGRPGD